MLICRNSVGYISYCATRRILHYIRAMSDSVQKVSPISSTDISSTAASDFDTELQKEIEIAKKEQRVKQRNNMANRNGVSKQMRDKSGFKLKLNDTNSLRHKQTDPEYTISVEGPLRKIAPYYFTYKTFCKLRWRDRKLLDVFVSEFRDREPSYYKKTIENGSVYLNNEPANLESVIKNGDLITHKVHRHEPPVTSRLIKIVFEDDNIIVIDKPSGVPVHPTGRYRFNTVTKILEKQLGYSVHPCNRLDKLTSGLMFLAKTPQAADIMADQMKIREVSKEYVARVIGEFPVEEVVVEKPMRCIDPRVSLNAVSDVEDTSAKHAKTIIKRIGFDGQTSIVKCKPFTGRTHQIRVHLQFLGFPIANDPIYSNSHVWGPNLGRNGEANFAEVARRLDAIGKTECAESWFHPTSNGEVLKGEKCPECETELYTDPGPNDLDLWLHAYRYESNPPGEGNKKWSYKTEFPEWALQGHKHYMELAIQEAKKCGPTQTAFNVGAVLVQGTKVLSTGYSREMPGNTHAEQCAMEKYFTKIGKRDIPCGTVLYTTMEPCSVRNSGNTPCLNRILNFKDKFAAVFVGIMEPDTFVANNTSLRTLEENGIDYIKIPGYEEECLSIATKGHTKI